MSEVGAVIKGRKRELLPYRIKRRAQEFLSSYILGFSEDREYDYDHYRVPPAQFLILGVLGGVIAYLGSWVFYRCIPISLMVLPLGVLLPMSRAKTAVEKTKNQLRADFGELLGSLADSLKTGMAFERALWVAKAELEKTEGGKRKRMKLELDRILSGVKAGIPVSQGFSGLGGRSGIDEIELFATVLPITLRKGGNLIELMRNTSERIKERARITEEIEVILAEKKMEKRLVDAAPFFMTYMLSVISPEFMAPVFRIPAGRIAMTFALMLFIVAWIVSGKIMKIEV